MTSFPVLKTGAVMQYPAVRQWDYQNTAVRFLDGSGQCYRETGWPLRRWLVCLDLLDETELSNLKSFFVGEDGRAGSFSFTDPWDDVEYHDCSVDQDSFEFELVGEMRARTVLIVRQNRS